MTSITLQEAQASLVDVVHRLAPGDSVTITENNRPVARLVPVTIPKDEAAEINVEEESILRAATIHLIRKVGGLFVATGLREEVVDGCRRWIIAATLRYAPGHEGYVADLLYDGKDFTLLTESSVIDERVRLIAADPNGIRQWNEILASTLRAGKA